MILAAAAGSGIKVENIIPAHMEAVKAKLVEAGVSIEMDEDSAYIGKSGSLKKVDIKTYAYPGFPTDLQQPMTALLAGAHGSSVVTDTIYPSRFKHIDELKRMGGRFKLQSRAAIVTGPTQLKGATVTASDLRAGASLVIAGLTADGTTEIHGIEHIERGYGRIIEKLEGIGADICKVSQASEIV
ncbi:UDP-N-acetylglucosamine 1-carboxyvinyltransferase [Listeria cornellensis FSL F6-0969]|uniref:UDP-N-acetylglucosamine 1-carboxyvinyltransferase n=1 Tax=Listeria cornellensis FSL F6-0969 TaxID=1265820 RepID=W7CHP4_9LIST|nr:UDP-N-acetylglucosamine 1-carboxyvinyltransferase [Listeria cornellensis FSL F6-0969]